MSAAVKVCVGYVVGGEPLNLPDGEYQLSAIAPPVAAGSVDIKTWQERAGLPFDCKAGECTDVSEDMQAEIDELRSSHSGVKLQTHQAMTNARNHYQERAEKAEAELESWVHTNRIDELQRELAHKQAVIDRLMLEYCPDEMTAEQIKEWGEHQVRAEVMHHPV